MGIHFCNRACNCIAQILLFTFFSKPHKLKCWADRWALTLTHVLSVSISDEYSQQNSDIEWDRRSK